MAPDDQAYPYKGASKAPNTRADPEEYTPKSLFFDIFLAIIIIISVVVGLLESVKSINAIHGATLLKIEWVFTILFTIEYLVRVIAAKRRFGYIFSFFGLIDLVSVLPTYLTLFLKSAEILQAIRLLRLVRIFSRLIKFSHELTDWSNEAFNLKHHLSSSERVLMFFRPSRKKWIFQYAVIILLIIGSITEIVYSLMPVVHVFDVSISLAVSYIALFFSLILLLRKEYHIWSERYMVTTQRLLYSKGIFSEQFQSKTYQYITDVSLHQSLWDKLLNTGNLIITTASGEGDELKIMGVSDPLLLKKTINDNMVPSGKSIPQNIVENKDV